jgi:hypothetical protein
MQFVPFVTYFVIFQSLLALALSGCKVINKIIDNCFFFLSFFLQFIHVHTYVLLLNYSEINHWLQII